MSVVRPALLALLLASPALAEPDVPAPSPWVGGTIGTLSLCGGANPCVPPPTEACDPGDGVTILMGEGSAITGPFSMTQTRGFKKNADGSLWSDMEDDLTVQAGQTVVGPMTLCTRQRKP